MIRLLLATSVALTGCSPQTDDPQNISRDSLRVMNSASAPEATPASRFDAAKAKAMKQRLLEEPLVADILFDPQLAVEWQIGVLPSSVATMTAGQTLARRICRELRAAGLSDDNTDVRIVDLGLLEESPGDFRSASRGHVACENGESLGV